MGAVFKRKRKDKSGNIKESKNYWIKFYQHGKAISENSGTDKWADAKAFLKLREGEVAKGKPAQIRFDKVMLSELIQELKDDYKLKGQKRPRTGHLEKFFGGYRVIDVNTSEITKYINIRGEAGAANATINKELAALKRMLNIGAKSTPPKVDRVPHIQKLPEENVKLGFFEDGDFYAILENLPEYMKGVAGFA